MDKRHAIKRIGEGTGFIAALDQSAPSARKALELYGVPPSSYYSEEEMLDLIHDMRVRMMRSPEFLSGKIIGVILYRGTMERKVGYEGTAEYLSKNRIVPFLKIDHGLAEEKDGVRLMRPIPDLKEQLMEAKRHGVFGTKERSAILEANPKGIRALVDQQFEVARAVISAGMVPIIEPETSIWISDKKEAEDILFKELEAHLRALPAGDKVILKLTLPEVPDLYAPLLEIPSLLRLTALSGGLSREEANERLKENRGMIASFARALAEGLKASQSDDEFNETFRESIDSIYEASVK